MLRFHRTTIYLTLFSFLRVRLRTLCAQWTCHVPRTRLSRIHVSRITCHWLVYSYVSLSISHALLLVQIQTVDSCTYVSRLCLSPFVLLIRLSTHYSWIVTCLWLISLLRTFVIVSRSHYIYGLEMGLCSPSSIYFATTLKVWPVRSHELSLVLSRSLAKATALRLLGFVLCLLAYR